MSVTKDMVRRKGGGSLLSVFDDSLEKALASVYPEYNWDSSKFIRYYLLT